MDLFNDWRQDDAWLTARYDNRALVPEHGQFLQAWPHMSAAWRAKALAGGQAMLDQAYGTLDTQRLDVFGPSLQPRPQRGLDRAQPSGKGRACVVYLHGGWWRALHKDDFSFVAEPFVQQGACVVVPNYTLCPAATIEDIAIEMANAVAWVWRRADDLGIDRRRIVLVGHSAGGHLAALLTRCRWQDIEATMPDDPIAHAIALSGVFDLEPVRHVPFLKADLRLDAASVARLSPARMRPPPKALRTKLTVMVGALESSEFLRQSRLIKQAWGAAVNDVVAIEGHHHLSIVNHWATPGTDAHARTLQALPIAR